MDRCDYLVSRVANRPYRLTAKMGGLCFLCFLLVFSLSFLQGCIVWIPMDVDYDVEIELNKQRPNLNTDIGFIHYTCTAGRASGYHLYNEGITTNHLKVFLLPQKLYDNRHRYGYTSDCDVIYPLDPKINSFQNVNLEAFTKSVGKCFDKQYRLKKCSECDQYGESVHFKDAGMALELGSSQFTSEHTEEDTNAAMEHSLQAILLRAKYPHVPALHERRSFLKRKMLQTNPQFPITTLQELTCATRCELLTDDGTCAGSVTVRYPFYIRLTNTDCGADEAELAAMSHFLTMFCDSSKNGRYNGTITSFIPLFSLGCEKPIAKVGRFERVEERK